MTGAPPRRFSSPPLVSRLMIYIDEYSDDERKRVI